MLTQSFLTSLERWQKEGPRCVKIEIDSQGLSPGNPKIWIYDYALASGVFVHPGDPLPSKQELREVKRKRLQEEMANL